MPALAGELLRRGRQRVRHRMPDVGLAVAVEIDGVFVIFRRQKLREAHGAAPGRAQIRARHAVLQHLQRVEEFVAEEILALAGEGLRRQHAHGIEAVLLAAVIGLARPDRQHHGAGHAELALDARQRVLVLRGECFALRGQAREGRLAQILPRRLHEFGLLRRRLLAAGDVEIGQRQIRLEPARRGIEDGARDAERLRVRPGRLQPLLERRVGESWRNGKQQNDGGES